ncbi:MAG: DivIVA domain-containing protein [Actinomycetota bacterium]|nr:DivIVA domain-containing protein [Actinomycetota bacterium]
MDFGARAIREAQFREKMRGYNPEDVDTFLEQVAKGVEILEDRNRKLGDRVTKLENDLNEALEAGPVREPAPAPAAPAQANVEASQELLEIFQMAKRTADEVVAKAKSEADALLSDAKRNAADLERTARAEVAAMREAETERLAGEVREFEAKRDALLDELHRLADLASGARAKVRNALAEAMASMEASFSGLYQEESGSADAEMSDEAVADFSGDDLFEEFNEE